VHVAEQAEHLSGAQLLMTHSGVGPPMFCFEGDEDFTTPTVLARQYFNMMKAPRKQFVPIHGGHFAMFMHSDEFLREFIEFVRPLAIG
jgi:pimeloyl-ACP methyl ester carboxylesterase